MAASAMKVRIQLTKREAEHLAREAKFFGITPEGYVKRLVKSELENARIARTRTFAQIMGPSKGSVDESEIDFLVEKARNEFQESSKKKRRPRPHK